MDGGLGAFLGFGVGEVRLAERRVRLHRGQGAPLAARVAATAAAAAADGSDDSDGGVGGVGPRWDAEVALLWQQACEPPRVGLPGAPTHVILRVLGVTGVPRSEAEAVVAVASGRLGLGHFLDGDPIPLRTATVCILRSGLGDAAQGPPSWRRCAKPELPLRTVGETVEARWGEAPGEAPGEARVRLRPGETAVRAGLVVGTEVLAKTDMIDLRAPARRFFAEHPLFRRVESLAPMPAGRAVLALELWPPGATFPPAPEDEEEEEEVEDAYDLQASLPAVGRIDGGGATCATCGALGCTTHRSTRPIPPCWEKAESSAPHWGQVVESVCFACDGVGRRTCEPCGGHGSLVCQACDGMPPLPCAQCGGTGYLQDGLEAISRGGGGASASAVGGRRCTACWGAPQTCPECFGVAALRCVDCSGAGWSPCLWCVPRSRRLLA